MLLNIDLSFSIDLRLNRKKSGQSNVVIILALSHLEDIRADNIGKHINVIRSKQIIVLTGSNETNKSEKY